MATGKVCPIFSVSNCTGEGIDTLRHYLSSMPRSIYTAENIVPETTTSTDQV